jgi:hypothetical protein
MLDSAEPARALDRMNDAKYAGQRRAIPRILLQLNEFAVERVQISVTFHEKLAPDFILHEFSASGGENLPQRREPNPRIALRRYGTSITRTSPARRNDRRVTDDSLNIRNVLSFLEEESAPIRHG